MMLNIQMQNIQSCLMETQLWHIDFEMWNPFHKMTKRQPKIKVCFLFTHSINIKVQENWEIVSNRTYFIIQTMKYIDADGNFQP